MHFERGNWCSQVEYHYSFDYKQEIDKRTDTTQGTLVSLFFNRTSGANSEAVVTCTWLPRLGQSHL